jgi:hypothetical protein
MFSRSLCKNVKYFEATKCNAAVAIKPRSMRYIRGVLARKRKTKKRKSDSSQSGQGKSETLVSQSRLRSKHPHGGRPSTRYTNSSKSTGSGEENRRVRKFRNCAKFPPGSQAEN